MSMSNLTPRLFTKADILSLNEGQYGVYGIYRHGTWIYIGKGDIRNRMLNHINGDIPEIFLHSPTHWVGMLAQNADELEKHYILQYNPVCNKKVG